MKPVVVSALLIVVGLAVALQPATAAKDAKAAEAKSGVVKRHYFFRRMGAGKRAFARNMFLRNGKRSGSASLADRIAELANKRAFPLANMYRGKRARNNLWSWPSDADSYEDASYDSTMTEEEREFLEKLDRYYGGWNLREL